MKLKSIIACGLMLLTVGAATTSCEDMFTADNKLVTTDLAPKDTVYQVMGIINRMQKLADRTVLLGELRGDLVDVDPAHSTVYLQELGANNVSVDNIYNQPADYYDVINNCNIYLAHVDSLYKVHGKYFYKNEVIGVKTFRAWCYLELAKIYGEVPFVTEPVLTPEAAEQLATSSDKRDITYITSWLIDDLKGYVYEDANYELIPSYVADGKTTYSKYFIPVRIMLGELYLWRATYTDSQSDYIDAVRMYHNYLTWQGEERPTSRYKISFYDDANFESLTTSYANSFDYGQDPFGVAVAYLPVDTIEHYGYVSDIRAIFCSSYKNEYYPAAVMSARLDSISQGQIVYNLKRAVGTTPAQALPAPREGNSWNSSRMIGDLRLYDILTEKSQAVDKYHPSYSRVRTFVSKWLNGGSSISTDQRLDIIPYYRYTTIYLHMAEALNRAGFPETAFAVLKWGITEETLANRSIVSEFEFDRLDEIKSYANRTAKATLYDATGSFLVWPYNSFVSPDKLVATSSRSVNQIGIHTKGSGDAEYNPTYVLPADSSRWDYSVRMPTDEPKYNKKEDPDSVIYKELYAAYADSLEAYTTQLALNRMWLYDDSKEARIKYVAERILDEEALELCYEGTRFYDLMRFVRQSGDKGNNVVIPAYIKQTYGAVPSVDNKYDGTSWYLPLPKK